MRCYHLHVMDLFICQREREDENMNKFLFKNRPKDRKKEQHTENYIRLSTLIGNTLHTIRKRKTN